MRAARKTLGLKRLELYAHHADWPDIKALAKKMQKKRAKMAAMETALALNAFVEKELCDESID